MSEARPHGRRKRAWVLAVAGLLLLVGAGTYLGRGGRAFDARAASGRERPPGAATVVRTEDPARGPVDAAGPAAPRFVTTGNLTITGTLVTADGRPVAGAPVGASGAEARIAETDAAGRFTLTGLGPAPVTLYAVAPGQAPVLSAPVLPGARDVRLVVPRAARVRGQVRPGGLPAGALVELCDRERRETDSDRPLCVARVVADPVAGGFALDRLAPGRYDLVVTADGFTPVRRSIEVGAGAEIDVPPVDLLATR